jgi:predicted aspartyl protease
MWKVAALLVVLCIVLRLRREDTPMRLEDDGGGNEAMVVQGSVGGQPMLFMIDTAYAGAPVLSLSYLALSPRLSYRAVAARLGRMTNDDRHRALRSFLQTTGCRSFTSGCTMRLMGIGNTSEAQSDMLLCSGLGVGGFHADVFVTNPLPGSVHILTIDFLMHRAPCVLLPARGAVLWAVRDPLMQASFEFHTPALVGGALRIPMKVGGTVLQIVVDTGAAAALSIGKNAVDRIATCASTARKATQRGVNGEKVCSDVLVAGIQIGGIDLGEVEVFANDSKVEGADGYAGMGMLRALDLWIAPGRLGLRRSGLPTRRTRATRDGTCGDRLPCTRKQETN